MNEETRLLLWVLCASDGKVGELHHVYASTEVRARQEANAWIIEQAMLKREVVEIKHWPGGFVAGYRAYWPGSIPSQPAESEARS